MGTKTHQQAHIRQLLDNPEMYNVVLFNDDFTTMEFVVEMLMQVFFYDATRAEQLMLTVHRQKSAVAGTYTLDIANSKKRLATDMARNAGYPLRIEVEPADNQ